MRMNGQQWTRWSGWLLALLMMVMASGVQATTALELTTERQTELSDLIVLVEVGTQYTFKAEDGKVYTDTKLTVLDVLAGEAQKDQVLKVRQWGGTLEGLTHYLPGDAVFTEGEQAVVFLADREPENGVLFLTAMAQSKLDVVGMNDSGDLLLNRDLQGLTFYDPKRAQPIYVPDVASSTTLGTLVKGVQAAELGKESK